MSSATEDIFQRLESAIAEWSAEVKSSTAGITEKLARARDRLDEAAQDSGELAGISSALEFAQSQFTRLESTLRETLGTAQEALRRADAVDGRLAGLNDDVNTLREELRSVPRESAETAAGAPVSRDEALVAEVEALRAELGRLREQAPASETFEPNPAVREEIDDLRAQLAQLRESLHPGDAGQMGDSVPAELTTLRNELAQLRQDLEQTGTAVQRIEELEGLLSAERQRTDRVAQELSEISLAAKSGSAPQNLSDDVNDLRQELAQLRSQRMDETDTWPPESPPLSEELAEERAPTEERAVARELYLTGFDEDGQRLRMGEILVKAGVVTEAQVEEALLLQEEEPQRRIGSILVDLGLTESDVVGQALACQLRLPFVRLEEEVPTDEAIRLVNGRLASHHRCMPVHIANDVLVLAMANPLDLIAIEDMELATGKRVDPVVAAEADISKAIEWFYVNER